MLEVDSDFAAGPLDAEDALEGQVAAALELDSLGEFEFAFEFELRSGIVAR